MYILRGPNDATVRVAGRHLSLSSVSYGLFKRHKTIPVKRAGLKANRSGYDQVPSLTAINEDDNLEKKPKFAVAFIDLTAVYNTV